MQLVRLQSLAHVTCPHLTIAALRSKCRSRCGCCFMSPLSYSCKFSAVCLHASSTSLCSVRSGSSTYSDKGGWCSQWLHASLSHKDAFQSTKLHQCPVPILRGTSISSLIQGIGTIGAYGYRKSCVCSVKPFGAHVSCHAGVSEEKIPCSCRKAIAPPSLGVESTDGGLIFFHDLWLRLYHYSDGDYKYENDRETAPCPCSFGLD